MPVRGIDHYNLRAHRAVLDDLRDFYRDVVGLVEGQRPPFGNHGYWMYAGEQAVLHLSEAAPMEDRRPAPKSTFDHVAFTCEDIEAMRATLEARGIRYRVADVPLTKLRQVFFDDPAGNGIELNFRMPG